MVVLKNLDENPFNYFKGGEVAVREKFAKLITTGLRNYQCTHPEYNHYSRIEEKLKLKRGILKKIEDGEDSLICNELIQKLSPICGFGFSSGFESVEGINSDEQRTLMLRALRRL